MADSKSFPLQPTLVGETLLLRPLADDDFERLYAVAADPLIWEQHPEPTRHRRDVFEGFFANALASGGAFLVIEKATGAVAGSSRFYDWIPGERAVTIGYTFLARRLWGGPANREMKRLMLDHAFRFADTVWFTVGKSNLRSRRAMEKIGGVLARETTSETGGIVRHSVWYRIDRVK